MLSLELPHRGNSNEYTQYTIFNIKREIDLNYLTSAATGFFPRVGWLVILGLTAL